MEITIHNRYSKEIIEPFAISTIAKSFDSEYGNYYSPKDTNNFDYLSLDGTKAIEITVVVPENEKQGMIYEKELAKGKHPSVGKVSRAKTNENGNLISYRGGSMSEIRSKIKERIEEKNAKANKLGADSAITGIYFYMSAFSSDMVGKPVYVDNIQLVVDYKTVK